MPSRVILSLININALPISPSEPIKSNITFKIMSIITEVALRGDQPGPKHGAVLFDAS
eukprot:Pgem_evm1s16070